jgi:carbonic anhydrase/acetyltransferase-like protein (isoleucine patch superfamily)
MIFSVGGYSPQIHPTAFIHPTAEISGKVRIGARASIWGGCILRGDIDWIEIGDESNVQDLSVFHTTMGGPVKLGKGVTIGHRAVVHGATVKDYSLIGMGVVLLDYSVVEENCLIGANAVVKERGVIPKGQLAFGTPAKVVRPLTPDEVNLIVNRAADYVRLSDQYRASLKAVQLL